MKVETHTAILFPSVVHFGVWRNVVARIASPMFVFCITPRFDTMKSLTVHAKSPLLCSHRAEMRSIFQSTISLLPFRSFSTQSANIFTSGGGTAFIVLVKERAS